MLNARRISPSGGFTLVEMMIGIAIVSMVLAIGIPSFNVWLQNSRIRNTAQSILNGLQLARSEAVLRNTQVQFKLDSGSGWIVGCVVPTSQCPETIQSRPPGEGGSSAITISAPDGMPIQFDGLGKMVGPALAGGATSTRIDVDINPSVLSASDSRELRVTIALGGAIRMCDPSISTANDTRACQ